MCCVIWVNTLPNVSLNEDDTLRIETTSTRKLKFENQKIKLSDILARNCTDCEKQTRKLYAFKWLNFGAKQLRSKASFETDCLFIHKIIRVISIPTE